MAENINANVENNGTGETADTAAKTANELIVVKQLPIIVEQLQTISEKIKENTKYALSLEVTEDNYKAIKGIRAELTAAFNALETRRKEIKKQILAPYDELEEQYKLYVTNIYGPAKTTLDERIGNVEGKLKQEKSEKIKDYFVEYTASKNVDFLKFEDMDLNITLSATEKGLKAKVKATVDKVCDDLAMIDTQEHKEEILVEYKKNFNVSQAILTVTNRFKAIEAERALAEERAKRAAEQNIAAQAVDEAVSETEKVEAFSAPVVFAPAVEEVLAEETIPESTTSPSITEYTASFKVRTTNIEHLKTLKKTLEKLSEEGLKYEQF